MLVHVKKSENVASNISSVLFYFSVGAPLSCNVFNLPDEFTAGSK